MVRSEIWLGGDSLSNDFGSFYKLMMGAAKKRRYSIDRRF